MQRLTWLTTGVRSPHTKRSLSTVFLVGAVVSVILVATPARANDVVPRSGMWRAWLDSPGGELPFGLEISQVHTSWRAWIINAPERIEIPKVSVSNGTITFSMEHYESTITATVTKAGKRLDGEWKKRGAGDTWTTMSFHADRGRLPRFPSEDKPSGKFETLPLDGKWAVDFSKSDDESVGLLHSTPDGLAGGTFLTSMGDYRYLTGSYKYGHVRLSTFDGAHAFLFDAHMLPYGKMKGDFWSSDTWHETWAAELNPLAMKPDPFWMTTFDSKAQLEDLSFPDLEGHLRKLSDPAFAGKVRIIELFGSWCPNSNDAALLLKHLQNNFASADLSILGLAFEHGGHFERNARQVQRYITRHQIEYPILIAGLSDKDSASKSFPVIDRVRAFPTFLFIDHNNRIKSVYTGFTGPTARAEHLEIRWKFEQLIRKLLKEANAATPSPANK